MDAMRPREVDLQTLAFRAEGVAWDLMAPTRLRYAADEGLLVENLLLERSGPAEGRLSINGMVPPTGDTNLQISAERVDLADWRRIVPTAPALEGNLTLNASLTGPVEDPELVMSGQIDQLLYEGVLTESIGLNAAYSGRVLTAAADVTAGGQRLVQVELGVPMALSLENRLVPAFELLRNDPFSMTVRADSLPLSIVAALVPGIDDGTGLARAQKDLSGTIEEPFVVGSARIDNGAVFLEQAAVRYSEIRVHVGLLHQLEDLPGIGGQALDVAALAVGVDGVERERALAGAGQPGDHDQRVARQIDVDRFQIVLARAADADELVHGPNLRSDGSRP
jgi:autotransporter translocation and assembly factor TamB